MLYDGEDRMSRPKFLKTYNVDPRTEKRVRTKGRLPWPSTVVMGGRVFYSKTLTAAFFAQQAGVASAEVTETSDNGELIAAAALGAGGAEPPDEPVMVGGDAP